MGGAMTTPCDPGAGKFRAQEDADKAAEWRQDKADWIYGELFGDRRIWTHPECQLLIGSIADRVTDWIYSDMKEFVTALYYADTPHPERAAKAKLYLQQLATEVDKIVSDCVGEEIQREIDNYDGGV
jgi:hypothetical protein